MTPFASPKRQLIFLSYRRDDAKGASGRLYDWLRIAFGRETVFRDVATIGVGKWRDKINHALAGCRVCVAVIGPRWANADNARRLHQTEDMVRHELVTALGDEQIVLVPTLVEGAALPANDALPSELQPLFGVWNACTITENGWEDDTRRLIADIAAETALIPVADLESLLHDVAEARQRIVELEQTNQLQAEQLEALRRAHDDLMQRLAEAGKAERPQFVAAFAALAKGDSRQAEAAFEQEYDSACATAAEAARHIASLAASRDVEKTVAYYRKALALDPEHAETSRLLGMALVRIGKTEAAEQAYRQSLAVAERTGDPWGVMAALGGIGDIAVAQGNLKYAEAVFGRALLSAQTRVEDEPENTQWQRDLSVSHNKIGDVLVAQGQDEAALAAYRQSLGIHEWLAAYDPANTQWQRDLSVSHEKMGNVLVAQGLIEAALADYRQSLAIREQLAAHDPANTQWQRDLSVSQDKTGDVLVAQGQGEAALAACRQSLGIREQLAAHDPANTQWQRDISVNQDMIGDVLVAQGQGEAALAAYRQSLSIRERLAAHDPANTQWQRDLSVSHDRIGNVLVAQGRGEAALAAYRQSLGICERLAAHDPANTEWQRDLIVSNVKLFQVSGECRFVLRALEIACDLAARGVLQPRDDWMVDELTRMADEAGFTGQGLGQPSD